MKKTVGIFVAFAVSAFNVGSAAAQLGLGASPQYTPRPAVSPYLNMLRGGNAAINYYGVVRPQIQTSMALQRLQYQQNTLMLNQGMTLPSFAEITPLPAVPTTGHPVQFLNSSRYFLQAPNRTGLGTVSR